LLAKYEVRQIRQNRIGLDWIGLNYAADKASVLLISAVKREEIAGDGGLMIMRREQKRTLLSPGKTKTWGFEPRFGCLRG